MPLRSYQKDIQEVFRETWHLKPGATHGPFSRATLNGTNATQESYEVIEMPAGRFQQRTLVTPASSSTPVPLGTEKFPLALEKGTEGGYELL